MTTTTKDLKAKLKAIDPKDIEKAHFHISGLISAGCIISYAVRAKRAAKAGDYQQATYYAVIAAAGQAGLRYKLDDGRRKGYIK